MYGHFSMSQKISFTIQDVVDTRSIHFANRKRDRNRIFTARTVNRILAVQVALMPLTSCFDFRFLPPLSHHRIQPHLFRQPNSL